MAITLHLSLFLSVSITLVSYLMFEVIYLSTGDDTYHEIVNYIRVAVQICTCALESFIAFMLYKFTYPAETYYISTDDSPVQSFIQQSESDCSIASESSTRKTFPSFIKSYLAGNNYLDQRILQELTIKVTIARKDQIKLKRSRSLNDESLIEQIDIPEINENLVGR